jgi:hypothetical protein
MLTVPYLPEPLLFSHDLPKLPGERHHRVFLSETQQDICCACRFLSQCKPIGIDLWTHTNRPNGQWTSRYVGLSIKPWFELQCLQ